MKAKTILFFLLISAAAYAQGPQQTITTYEIDAIRPDSFYLVEVIETVNPAVPRPSQTLNYQLFKSPEQLTTYLDARATQVAQARAQADEYEKLTAQMKLTTIANAAFLGLDKKKKRP